MSVMSAVLFFSGLLLVSYIVEPLANKSRLPFSVFLILIGYIASEIAVGVFSFDTGVRWDNFQFLILSLLLPVLIFQAALNLELKFLLRDTVVLFFLAFPFMLLTVLIIATILFYGIAYPEFFNWHSAIIAGALLSATDPAAVIKVLRKAGVSTRLITLLESESLLNDATAVVLFMIFISLDKQIIDMSVWESTGLTFTLVFAGGLLSGLCGALLLLALYRLTNKVYLQIAFTLITVYASYLLATRILSSSGVIAVLTLGLLLKYLHLRTFKVRLPEKQENFWLVLGNLMDKLIYILAGVSITAAMFYEQYLAMILGVIAVLSARSIVIFLALPLLGKLPKIGDFKSSELAILNWGGSRGTVTLALALSLPLTLDTWYTLQSIAYGVVLFTVFIQATTMPLMLHKTTNSPAK